MIRTLLAAALLLLSQCHPVPAAPAFAPYTEDVPPLKPDKKLSPGDVMKGVTVEQICVRGYANVINGGVRNVPESERRAVFVEYFGYMPKNPGLYEVDHIISLQLGGSNSIKNLFPQAYTGPWGARVKDRLESWMAADVRHCLKASGHDAAQALLALHQKEISTDWIAAYKKYLKRD